jgi:CIC family chloride channel protein
MAAMMGGTMRAPLTGTFFAVELTGDVSMLVPLLAATVAAYAVTVLLLRRSILTEKVARRGQHITREYGIDPFELTRAREIMIKEVDTLAASMTVGDSCNFFATPARTHRVYPVVDGSGVLKGLVSGSDALRWQDAAAFSDQRLDDMVSDASIPAAHPDDTVGYVADLMLSTGSGRIPIVDPQTAKLHGLVARKDLLRLRSTLRATETQRRPFLGPRKANDERMLTLENSEAAASQTNNPHRLGKESPTD